MTTKQVSVLKRYIDENPNLSNRKLAELIVEKSLTFKGYSAGSVANYLGKVKKMNPKTVNTTKGHLNLKAQQEMDNIEAAAAGLISPMGNDSLGTEPVASEFVYCVHVTPNLKTGTKMIGMVQMINKIFKEGLMLSKRRQEGISADNPLTFRCETQAQADDIAKEAFGYGYNVDLERVPVNGSAQKYIAVSGFKSTDINTRLGIVKLICKAVGIDEGGYDFNQIYQGIGNLTEDQPMILSFDNDAVATELYNSLDHRLLKFAWAVPADEKHVEFIDGPDALNVTPVGYNPNAEGDKGAKPAAKAQAADVTCYNFLTVGVTDEAFVLDYTGYTTESDVHSEVVVFGNEPRGADFNANGTINAVSGGLGGTTALNGDSGGLREGHCLYDAIDFTINEALKVNSGGELPTQITIVTDSGFDWGSRYSTADSVRELITMVQTRHNFNVTLVSKAVNIKEVAEKLGIGHTISYLYSRDIMDQITSVIPTGVEDDDEEFYEY